MPEFGGGDCSVGILVEDAEALDKVFRRSRVLPLRYRLVDRDELLELDLILCKNERFFRVRFRF